MRLKEVKPLNLMVTITLNTFQRNEKNIVDEVARLIKMCENRRRADEFIVILYGAAMLSSPKRSLSWRLPPQCLDSKQSWLC